MKCESCGKAVPCGSEFCPHCGCVAVSPKKNEKSEAAPAYGAADLRAQEQPLRLGRSERKKSAARRLLLFYLIGTVLCFAALGIAVAVNANRSPEPLPAQITIQQSTKDLPEKSDWQVSKQDIGTISGCPEFFGLKWGSSPERGEETIPIPYEKFSDGETGECVLSVAEPFYLYGMWADRVDAYYTDEGLYCVEMEFADDSAERLAELLTEIYGEPQLDPYGWSGPFVTIQIEPNYEGGACLRYEQGGVTPSEWLYKNAENGTRIDPLGLIAPGGFLADGEMTERKLLDCFAGMEEFVDYGSYREGYYWVAPDLAYMGRSPSETRLELFFAEDGGSLGVAAYSFWIDWTDMADVFCEFRDTASMDFGEVVSYSISTDYEDEEVSCIEEMLLAGAAKPGCAYYIDWETEDFYVWLYASVDGEDCICSMTFCPKEEYFGAGPETA